MDYSMIKEEVEQDRDIEGMHPRGWGGGTCENSIWDQNGESGERESRIYSRQYELSQFCEV